MENTETSSHPRSQRIENAGKVWNLMHSDRHLSIRAMVVQTKLDKETV
jgi:hypothetical protein